jgi:uncharacterized protein (DUF362 family)
MDQRIFLEDAADIMRLPKGRRSFLKTLALGGAGAAFSTLTSSGNAFAAKVEAPDARVSLVTGADRRDNIHHALEPLKREIKRALRTKKRILIKPNLVGNETILGVTHPDAVRGLLDIIKPLAGDMPISIGESTGRRYDDLPGTVKHYVIYNYFPLEREYGVTLVDLNAESFTTEWVLGPNGAPMDIRTADRLRDPDTYVIALNRLKAHNCVCITISAKNILMGCPVVDGWRHDKKRMHSGTLRNMNYNLFLLARNIQPDLAVVDGLEGMEGNGPNHGQQIDHGVAMASTDFIALDSIGCELMNVYVTDVGYLTFCGAAGIGQTDRDKIKVIGADPSMHVIPYRMHDNFHERGQLSWKY